MESKWNMDGILCIKSLLLLIYYYDYEYHYHACSDIIQDTYNYVVIPKAWLNQPHDVWDTASLGPSLNLNTGCKIQVKTK